jgi:hypothetical protein
MSEATDGHPFDALRLAADELLVLRLPNIDSAAMEQYRKYLRGSPFKDRILLISQDVELAAVIKR